MRSCSRDREERSHSEESESKEKIVKSKQVRHTFNSFKLPYIYSVYFLATFLGGNDSQEGGGGTGSV